MRLSIEKALLEQLLTNAVTAYCNLKHDDDFRCNVIFRSKNGKAAEFVGEIEDVVLVTPTYNLEKGGN